jgi:hypothetical protein
MRHLSNAQTRNVVLARTEHEGIVAAAKTCDGTNL